MIIPLLVIFLYNQRSLLLLHQKKKVVVVDVVKIRVMSKRITATVVVLFGEVLHDISC